jgi:tagaturonate reductase
MSNDLLSVVGYRLPVFGQQPTTDNQQPTTNHQPPLTMILNRRNLAAIKGNAALQVPEVSFFDLPEKVLQFGTGVLLRGLPDYFIDKANRQGIFNGRVVVVKSTDRGTTAAFDDQDSLYTLCIRGIEDGLKVEENLIVSSISRVLTAGSQWAEILQVATSPHLEVVFSNTTEVGIQLVDDDITASPPISFPGKLLAVLLARYQAFPGDTARGLVIVPTELVPGNGDKLQAIVLEQARRHQLDAGFIDWLEAGTVFCNSLVDRIVPGKPDAAALAALEQQLGYQDKLLAMSEVYRLWAIQGDARVEKVLTFAQADAGVIIAPDIDIYRELKLRLLNGSHSLCCGLAFLAPFETVKEAMDHADFQAFITALMRDEIAPAIPYPVPPEAAAQFARQVLDRFRNPHIKHQWISISLSYTAKLKLRIIPVLSRYYEVFGQAPELMALGFAAYLQFMHAEETEAGKYYGRLQGEKYPINDDQAAYFYGLWQQLSPEHLVDTVLANQELWGQDLGALPGFAGAVKMKLAALQQQGVVKAIRDLDIKQISA